MGLTLLVASANASPPAITSGGATAISVTAVSDATPTRALARYVLSAGDPFVFGHDEKELHSDLVFVGPVGTPITTRVQIKRTGAQGGLVPVDIFVSERDASGTQIGAEQGTSVDVDVQ